MQALFLIFFIFFTKNLKKVNNGTKKSPKYGILETGKGIKFHG